MNKTPEQMARDNIEDQLDQAGWVIQDRNKIKLAPDCAVAVREYPTDNGPADYVLFLDRYPIGVIEAKKETEGVHLTAVEGQSKAYAEGKLKYLDNAPLPIVYESTGLITRFTDYRDPKPRSREVFYDAIKKTLQLVIEKKLREEQITTHSFNALPGRGASPLPGLAWRHKNRIAGIPNFMLALRIGV